MHLVTSFCFVPMFKQSGSGSENWGDHFQKAATFQTVLLATQVGLSFKQQIFKYSKEDDELFEDYVNSVFWDLKRLLGANNDIWVETPFYEPT